MWRRTGSSTNKNRMHGYKKLLQNKNSRPRLRDLRQNKDIFVLYHKDLAIGTLQRSGLVWKFSYSKAFKLQNEISPIVIFPDKNKVYESRILWPFFASRIPSLKRPSIQKILTQEDIDENNVAALLRRFGRKTITNPFILEEKIKSPVR